MTYANHFISFHAFIISIHKEFLENASEFGALAPKAPKTSLFGRKRAAGFGDQQEKQREIIQTEIENDGKQLLICIFDEND